MLDIKKFDLSSYQEVFEKMCNELTKRSGVTFYDSDMEIVLLELWSLLFDMQSYTMDVNSERLKKEMLRFLLGDFRKRTSASGILLAKQSPSKWIFKHTRFDQIANLPFEVTESTYIQDNEIIGVCNIKNDQCIPWKKDMILEKGTQLELTLCAPMEINRPFILYFEIENDRITPSNEYKQATITCCYENNHSFTSLAYEDETQGFLTSGRFLIFPFKQHRKMQDDTGWKVWIKVEDAWYDQAPKLHDIVLNPLKISQQETYATSMIFPMQEDVFLQDALAMDGVIYLFVYQNDSYQKISFTGERGAHGVHVRIPKDYEGDHLLFLLQRKDIEIVGSTNGMSTQKISIPYRDVAFMRLLIKQADGWHDTTVFDCDTYQKEQRYGAWYDEQEGCLQFGCGKDFLILEKGNDNIIFRDLVLSKGKKGNIKEHVLTSEYVEQRYPTKYGQDDETLQEAQKRIPKSMAQASSLSVDDIQKVAQRFPGNALSYVRCVPKKYLRKYHKEKGYVVMLGNHTKLSDRYLSMMTHWLKRELPMGICIELMQAEEVPISIFVEAKFSPNEKEGIHQCLKTWMNQKTMGDNVRSVDLIEYLRIHTVIKEVQSCYFYIRNEQLDQFRIPYDAYLIIAKIHTVAT